MGQIAAGLSDQTVDIGGTSLAGSRYRAALRFALTKSATKGNNAGIGLPNFVYRSESAYARVRLCGLLLSLFVSSRSLGQFLSTEHAVNSSEVRVGLSSTQSGGIGALAVSVKEGYLAFFGRVNRQGGVYGRMLRLIDYDDDYQALNAVANTEGLINGDKVFALAGCAGASVSEPVLAMVNGARLVFFAPVSGGLGVRQPLRRYVFSLRASYLDESRLLVRHLVEDVHVGRIALVCRYDGDGDSAREALQTALAEHSLRIVSEGDYVRNTMEVQEAFERVIDGNPEAVILFGAGAPCAQFIQYARKRGGWPLILCCTSNVDLEHVQRLLGPQAEGVIGSQVVPSPLDADSDLVREYQADMTARGYQDFDHASLEGYVGARVFVTALQTAGPALTEQGLSDALANGTFTCGPLTFAFDGNLQQRNHAVFLTQISHGRLVPTQQIGLPVR
jgi:branched-chain amino acid transport system substrate-binding protein